MIDQAWLERVRQSIPELPAARRQRYQDELGLSAYDASVLVADGEVADYFEGALGGVKDAKATANWVINEVLREVSSEQPLSTLKVRPRGLAALVSLIEDGTISGKIAKQVFGEMLTTGHDPDTIIEAKGLKQLSDPAKIGAMIDEILAANPGQHQAYVGGKVALLGFFVGQVMKASRGKANPQVVNQLLREKLA